MASDLDRSDEVPFSELERGFFEAAPPDVAAPPPEPMRFDDLDPIAPPRSERAPAPIVQRARKLTSAARTRVRSLAIPTRARATVSAARSALRAFARVALERSRPVLARLVAIYSSTPRERRLIAAGAAALIVVTSVSAAVVASRGGDRPAGPVIQPVAVAAGAAAACEAPPAPPPVTLAAAEAAPPLLESTAPQPMPPSQRKRKQVKGSATRPARAKASVKIPTAPGARPMFSR